MHIENTAAATYF